MSGLPAGLPLASFRVIDLQKLRQGDEAEKQTLFAAAKVEGFFYLNYENLPEYDEFESIISSIYELEHHLFGLSEDQKMAFDVDTFGKMKLNGYKPIGRNVGGVGGKRDGFESWAIPKDGVLELGKINFSRPAVLDASMGLLDVYMRYMTEITTIIHSALSDCLGIAGTQRLENFHRSSHASPCILRLLKYHAQPACERGAPQTPHTDLGSLTVLFTRQPGLQVLPKNGSADDWQFAAVKERCAIVNIGDVLTMLTGGELHSSLHRVGPLPGLPMDTRYSFAYLQRPEEHLVLKTTAEGEEITSGEWLRLKFGMLRKDTFSHDKQWILTGRQQQVIQT